MPMEITPEGRIAEALAIARTLQKENELLTAWLMKIATVITFETNVPCVPNPRSVGQDAFDRVAALVEAHNALCQQLAEIQGLNPPEGEDI